jgi:hypothetical protein
MLNNPVCTEGNKVCITLNCAEAHRWREQDLNGIQLGIKEIPHPVITTFKHIIN